MADRRRRMKIAGALALCILVQGCVTRSITILSEPAGGKAYLDNAYIGVTPVTVPFKHYGKREIRVEKEGVGAARTSIDLRPPWYQILLLDLICEVIIPYNFRDEREVTLKLEKPDLDKDAFLKRARAEREGHLIDKKRDGD